MDTTHDEPRAPLVMRFGDAVRTRRQARATPAWSRAIRGEAARLGRAESTGELELRPFGLGSYRFDLRVALERLATPSGEVRDTE
jgi:hypothetical protein